MKNLISVLAVALVSVSIANADDAPENLSGFVHGQVSTASLLTNGKQTLTPISVTAGFGKHLEEISVFGGAFYETASFEDSVKIGSIKLNQSAHIKTIGLSLRLMRINGTGLFGGGKFGLATMSNDAKMTILGESLSATFTGQAFNIGYFGGYVAQISNSIGISFSVAGDIYSLANMSSDAVGKDFDYRVEPNLAISAGIGFVLNF